jgi:hypothetical protein
MRTITLEEHFATPRFLEKNLQPHIGAPNPRLHQGADTGPRPAPATQSAGSRPLMDMRRSGVVEAIAGTDGELATAA